MHPSRDFDAPDFGDIEFRQLYERALERSAQLRARRTRRRAAAATAALACLLVVGLVAGSFAAVTAGRQPVASSWRLVSDVSAASSSWQALSPSGYEQAGLFSLVCPSDTTCYADSVGGQLEYTHDGGATWQQTTVSGTAMSLPQISCVDAQNCDVLADITGRGSTFLTTTDGGRTWTSRPGPAIPPNTAQNHLAVMSCATISSCVVIAYNGNSAGSSSAVFTTSDRGASWTQRTLGSPASREFVPSGLNCSGTTCVAVGAIGIWQSGPGPGGSAWFSFRRRGKAAYTSGDGGATWSASSAPPGYIPSLTCPDATDCYAADFFAVYHSKDGGQTWGQVSTSGLPGPLSPSSGWSFSAVSCASSSSCWLAGAANPPASSHTNTIVIGQAEGLLASTADGGSTWTLSTLPAGVGGVVDVTCPGTTTCFALGVEQTAHNGSKVVLLTNTHKRGRAV